MPSAIKYLVYSYIQNQPSTKLICFRGNWDFICDFKDCRIVLCLERNPKEILAAFYVGKLVVWFYVKLVFRRVFQVWITNWLYGKNLNEISAYLILK